MGKFDSKNKSSQVDVYQLIAERNAASSAKQAPRQAARPQQPVQQPVPQTPQQPRQTQPAEPLTYCVSCIFRGCLRCSQEWENDQCIVPFKLLSGYLHLKLCSGHFNAVKRLNRFRRF